MMPGRLGLGAIGLAAGALLVLMLRRFFRARGGERLPTWRTEEPARPVGADRLRLALGSILLIGGLLAAGLAGSVLLQAWQAREAHADSARAQPARSLLEVEAAVVWIEPSAEPASRAILIPTPTTTPRAAPVPTPRETPASTGAGPATPTPEPPSAAPEEVEVLGLELRFEDPPEPGARAVLTAWVRNHGAAETARLALRGPADWLDGFEVVGAVPSVLDDRLEADGWRTFEFAGLPPGAEASLSVVLTAVEDDPTPAEVAVRLGAEHELFRERPVLVAPRPRPGPAHALLIPALGLRSNVVQTAWEPPPFLIGQVAGSTSVSLGNTVLVGHLRGPEGNVFARLEQVRPGDEVVAISRGLEYRFVVSEAVVLPRDDSSPTRSTATPRLTLMTCTGDWNPLLQDYSHRLWVFAEPPELAAATIAANAERARMEAEAAAASLAEPAAEDPTPDPTAVATETPRPTSQPTVQPSATPSPSPAPLTTRIESPEPEARVPREVIVRGRREVGGGSEEPLWLFVRAEIPGSRWYAHPSELEVRRNGAWQVKFELGGQAGTRHEVRVGTLSGVEAEEVRRFIAQQPGQPFEDLPSSFQTEASVVVVRR